MNKKEDIDQNQVETYGIVYGSKPIYKQYSKKHYKYEFYYNGKKYSGSSIAYSSDNVKNGKFYKVEFSDKKPEHSRMIFDLEYIQTIKTDDNGKVTDTIYVLKDQEFRDDMNDLIEKLEFNIDSI